jgi:hypothetical protein
MPFLEAARDVPLARERMPKKQIDFPLDSFIDIELQFFSSQA